MRILKSVLVLSLLVSCRSEIKKPSAPEDIVPKTKMVSLTKDLLLLESHVELSYGQLNKFYKVLNSSTDNVFEKYKISRERYTRTFDYYASDQDRMINLYQEILDSLNIENVHQ